MPGAMPIEFGVVECARIELVEGLGLRKMLMKAAMQGQDLPLLRCFACFGFWGGNDVDGWLCPSQFFMFLIM